MIDFILSVHDLRLFLFKILLLSGIFANNQNIYNFKFNVFVCVHTLYMYKYIHIPEAVR